MAIFHFFEKDQVILHLNIESGSFEIEKNQLLKQGFERVGDPVHAENSQLAHEKFKKIQYGELHNSSTFLGAATTGGASNFLRFVTEIDTKKKSK